MAYETKVEFEGALYHVICRGNHRRDIFRKNPGSGPSPMFKVR